MMKYKTRLVSTSENKERQEAFDKAALHAFNSWLSMSEEDRQRLDSSLKKLTVLADNNNSIRYKRYLDWECTLNEKQVEVLLPVMNKYIFAEAQSVDVAERLFRCELDEPIKVKNGTNLTFFMEKLCDEGFLDKRWKKACEENRTFVGNRGAILTAKTLALRKSRMLSEGFFGVTGRVYKAINDVEKHNKPLKKNLTLYIMANDMDNAISKAKCM
ncbi:MAG: hypothetical protein IJ891_08430 [Prevotella sp.]|nr:hypothetical protein [Prevotella sp.]